MKCPNCETEVENSKATTCPECQAPIPPAPIFDPKKIPLPIAAKHPLRCSIQGDTHFIKELKEIVAASGIPKSLKLFIAEELDEMKSNAASVHLHLVDHPHGGGSLQVHWSPVHLGAKEKAGV